LVNDNKYPVQNCNENTTNHNTNKVPKCREHDCLHD